jgi:hypothetical protein
MIDSGTGFRPRHVAGGDMVAGERDAVSGIGVGEVQLVAGGSLESDFGLGPNNMTTRSDTPSAAAN